MNEAEGKLMLAKRLREARRRYAYRLFLRTLLVAIGVAGAAAGAMQLLGAGPDWLPLLLLASAPLLALLFTLAIILLRLPDLLATARRLERKTSLGLEERLSTATELASGSATGDFLRLAQESDAAAAAQQLDLRTLLPVRIPPALLLIAVAGLSFFFVFSIIPADSGSHQPHALAVQERELDSEEKVALAGRLEEAAAQFTQLGADENNQYLQAISRELSQLSERLQSQQMTSRELGSELERLLEHTRAAITPELNGEAATETLVGLPELLEAALRELEPAPADALAQEGSVNHDGTTEASPLDESAASESAADAAGTGAQLEMSDEMPEAAAGSSRGDGYTDITGLDEAALAELEARTQQVTEAGGEVIGASLDSTKGASQLAGDGTQELFGSEAAGQQENGALEQVALPEEVDPEGRHVKIEVTPDTEFTDVFATPLGPVSWSKAGEPPVQREPVTASLRSVTARYHLQVAGTQP